MEVSMKDLKEIFGETKKENPFSGSIGKCYFIRTVTYHYTGRVKDVIGDFIILSNAAWIADSGRFYDALKKEEFSEVEPFLNDVLLNIGSIVDATEISKTMDSQR